MISAAFLLTTSLVTTGAQAPATAATPGIGTVVASGTVTRNGTPDAAATVTVFAEPSSQALDAAAPSALRLLPLGVATTDDAGYFSVSAIMPTPGSDYVSPDHGTDIFLEVADPQSQLTWTYTLYPWGSATATGSPTSPASGATVPPNGKYPDGRFAPLTTFDLGTGAVQQVGDSPAQWLNDAGTELGVAGANALPRARVEPPSSGLADYAATYLAASATDRAAMLTPVPPSAGGTGPTGYAGGCGFSTWTNNYHYDVREHYVNAYSFSGAPVTVTEGNGTNNSFQGTLGVVDQWPDGSVTLGGTSGMSWDHHASASGLVNADISNRVNYRERATACVTDTQYKQYSYYDFLTDIFNPGHNDFSTCSVKKAGITWGTSTADNKTWSTGVSFPGIAVSAQSGYGSSTELSFDFTVKGYICGNSTSGPASSSQVSAKKY